MALKSFTKDLNDLTLEELSETFADVRSEFNKLVSIDHDHIVKCIGFCVISLSFVLELAPLGNLKDIMESYRRSGYYICPNSLVNTIKQVIIKGSYLVIFVHVQLSCIFSHGPIGNKAEFNTKRVEWHWLDNSGF